MNLRVVWRSAVVECGAQFVMMDGGMLMPGSYVRSLDLLQLVAIVALLVSINDVIMFMCILQELLLELKLSMVKAVVISSWTMWAVLEMRPDSLIVPTME